MLRRYASITIRIDRLIKKTTRYFVRFSKVQVRSHDKVNGNGCSVSRKRTRLARRDTIIITFMTLLAVIGGTVELAIRYRVRVELKISPGKFPLTLLSGAGDDVSAVVVLRSRPETKNKLPVSMEELQTKREYGSLSAAPTGQTHTCNLFVKRITTSFRVVVTVVGERGYHSRYFIVRYWFFLKKKHFFFFESA